MNSSPRKPFPRKAVLTSLFATGAALVAGSDAKADIIVVTEPSGGVDINNGAPFFQAYNLLSTTAHPLFNIHAPLVSSSSNRKIAISAGNPISNPQKFYLAAKTTFSGTVERFVADRFSTGKATTAVNLFNGFTQKALAGGQITSVAPSASSTVTPSPFYFAFQFNDANDNGALAYGWIEGEVTDNSYAGVDYKLMAYAYSTTPEPSSLVLGALGALIGGAAGVRRWRANRAAASSTVAS